MSTREDNLTTAADLRAWAENALVSARNSEASADAYQAVADQHRIDASLSHTQAAHYKAAAAVLEAYDGE